MQQGHGALELRLNGNRAGVGEIDLAEFVDRCSEDRSSSPKSERQDCEDATERHADLPTQSSPSKVVACTLEREGSNVTPIDSETFRLPPASIRLQPGTLKRGARQAGGDRRKEGSTRRT